MKKFLFFLIFITYLNSLDINIDQILTQVKFDRNSTIADIKNYIKQNKIQKVKTFLKDKSLNITVEEFIDIIDLSLKNNTSKETKIILYNYYKTYSPNLLALLRVSFYKKKYNVAKFFLQFKNFLNKINEKAYSNNETLLFLVTKQDNIDAIKILIDNGAYTFVSNDYDLSPAFYVRSIGAYNIYKNSTYTYNSDLEYSLCVVYINQNKIKKALPVCLKNAKLYETLGIYGDSGWYYILSKKLTKGLYLIKKRLKEQKDPSLYFNLGHIYLIKKNYKKTKYFYKKGFELAKKSNLNLLKQALLNDFFDLHKIYKTFDINKAFEIYNDLKEQYD